MRTIARLAIAAWFGSGLFLAVVAAPAAFSGAGDPEVAATIVGEMLSRWHWIAAALPLVALGSDAFRRRLPLILIVIALVLANGQWFVDNEIHEIRTSIDGPVSSLDDTDPIRRRFGMMHGISMVLLLGQVLCAAGLIVSDRSDDSKRTSPTD